MMSLLNFLGVHYVELLIVLMGPCVLLFVVVSARETWRDVKFACGGRLLRRGLRFRSPFRRSGLPEIPKIRFSLRTLFILTTLFVFQQALAFWYASDLPTRIIIIALTSFMGASWIFGAYLSSCNIPRRQQREDYRLAMRHQRKFRMPCIDTGEPSRFRPADLNAGSLEFESGNSPATS
jgi:hypothetical protein